MKWLRRVFLSVFVILCCLLLTSTVFLFTLSQITTKEHLKTFATTLVEQQLLQGTDVTSAQAHQLLLQQCMVQDTIELPLEGETITLSCDDVKKTTPDTFLAFAMGRLVDSLYYKDFGCAFLACVQTLEGTNLALLLISNTGHEFYNQIFLTLALIVLLTLVGILLLSDPRISGIKNIGICFIITGLGYFIFLYLKEMLPSTIQQEIPFINIIMETILNNFLIAFIIGIVFVLIGSFLTHRYKTVEETIKKLPEN